MTFRVVAEQHQLIRNKRLWAKAAIVVVANTEDLGIGRRVEGGETRRERPRRR